MPDQPADEPADHAAVTVPVRVEVPPPGPGSTRDRLGPVRSPGLRPTRAHLLAALLLGLLGFSLVVQARQNQSSLSSLSQSELVRVLDDVTHQAERLDAEARRLQEISLALRGGSDRAAAAEAATRSRLEVLGILAGTVPATGEGVAIRIDDPEAGVDAAQLLDTVQELRDAGAEAIQLGTVRVVASTSFVDVTGGGTGVIVDGATLTAPFDFTVIGDPQTIDTALDIPGGVLETLRQDGAHGTVRAERELTVSAVRPVRPPRYALPATGN